MGRIYLYLTAFPAMAHAFSISFTPTPTSSINGAGEKAIVPTTPGQIGVNPIMSDLGDPATYVGEIFGTDTQYITLDVLTTKVWFHMPSPLKTNFSISNNSDLVAENSGLASM